MAYGKTIELFLVDGVADGIVTAELSNWNGKAIKIPRIEVKESKRNDITLPGVYFLFCEDDSVYIGEAENIQERLAIHINDYNSGKEPYYWATAVCFVSKDLNKALIRYLENKLVELSKSAGKYAILTKNTYKKTVLKESQIASMDEFVDNIKVLIKTLGYSVLDLGSDQNSQKLLLHCKGNNASASGYPSANGFTVLKDSVLSDHTVPSFATNVVGWYELRNKLVQDGTFVDRVLQRDYEFSSPSAAAAIFLGRPSNGNDEWRTDKGIKLKDLDK